MQSRLYKSLVALMTLSACSESRAPVVACSPPLATWSQPHPHVGPDKIEFTIAIDHTGATYFNGHRSDMSDLAVQLEQVGKLENPEPAVILETEMGAQCEIVDEVRLLINTHLKCQSGGHCDEGVRAIWHELPYRGSGIP